MNYAIDWLPTAEQELAAIWLASADRDRITSAAHAADHLLGIDPEHEGESRANGQRVMFQKPLGVLFYVPADEWRVMVVHVWFYD